MIPRRFGLSAPGDTGSGRAGTVADVPADEPVTPHARIARELLHERSKALGPRLGPDGAAWRSSLSTIDLDENTTRTRVWLDDRPVTAGPHDGSPTWSPDGRSLAFTSRRGEKRGRRNAARHAGRRPRRGRAPSARCPRASGTSRGRPTARGSRSTAAPAMPATRRRTSAGSRRARSSASSPGSTARTGCSTGRRTCTWSRPTARSAAPRNLTPGEYQHEGVAWLPDSSGDRHLSASATTPGTDDLARGPLPRRARRRDHGAHAPHRLVPPAVGLARRLADRAPRLRRHRPCTRRTPGSA